MNNAREHRDKVKTNKPKRGGGSFKTKQRRAQRRVTNLRKPQPFYWPLVYTNHNFNQHELP